jgi:hypothetical protein
MLLIVVTSVVLDYYSFALFLLTLLMIVIFIYYKQKSWTKVMDQFFGAGNPGRYYKHHAREYTFRNTVVASFTARAQAIQRPGAHSNSSNLGDFENISKANRRLSAKKKRCPMHWYLLLLHFLVLSTYSVASRPMCQRLALIHRRPKRCCHF